MYMNRQKGIAKIVIMIVILVLAIVLPLTIKLAQQNQESRSKANLEGTCDSVGGVCLLYGDNNKSGTFCKIYDGNKDGVLSADYSCDDTAKSCCMPSTE